MIIAIGGGELVNNETFEIDKYIVESSKKENPNLLFIPTASHDSESYIETINKVYGSLGCNMDSLCLCAGEISKKEIKTKINNADIIYVGGGDTNYMMEVWNQYGVDKELVWAFENNKVLAGLSAGSMCWFISGFSASGCLTKNENVNTCWTKGLGIIPYLHCPHYDENGYQEFDTYYKEQSIDAIALENQVAVVWDNGQIKIIKSNPIKNAYYFSNVDNRVVKEIL